MIRNLLQTIRKNSLLIGTTICLVIAYACQEELVVNNIQFSGNEIEFSVTSDSTWQQVSRSAKSQCVDKKNTLFLATLGEDSVYIQMDEEENHMPFFIEKEDSTDSRGASLSSTSFKKIYLTAFLDVNNTYSEYMKNQLVELKSGKWSYSPIKYWPNDPSQKIHFFGYFKSKDDGVISNLNYSFTDGYQSSFNYTLPTPDVTNNDDAKNQPDLVFAITPNQVKTVGTVDLKFKHALSVVRFKLGTMPADIKVKSATVSIANVRSSGKCTMKYPLAEDENISWSFSDNTKDTYTQTYSIKDNQTIENDEEKFLMIPQTLKNTDAKLMIVFRIGEKDYLFEKNLADLTDEWKPNKIYTYTLTFTRDDEEGGYVEVGVQDEIVEEGTKKQNPLLQNTGLVTSYIRVAIVGYWAITDEAGNEEVIEPWDINDPKIGTLVKSSNWSDSWFYCEEDGFYYYREPVLPGEYTKVKLFESYKVNEGFTTGPLGSRLVINIMVQAIDAFTPNIKNYWPYLP